MDLMELAKLRWIQKWSVARLASHFGRRPDTIQGHLCRLRKSGKWQKMDFKGSELIAIKISIDKVFRGIF